MRPNCIVVPTPRFDDDLGFMSAAEPLDAEALVAETAVEASAFNGWFGGIRCVNGIRRRVNPCSTIPKLPPG
jgi:hypothetical protein